MTFLFALCAGFCNSFNVVAQHRASTSSGAHLRVLRLVLYLFKNPLWLLGWVALLGGFVFQALALHLGTLSQVQALLISELVFTLALRRLWIRQRISRAAWASAALTCSSLAVFVVLAEPQGTQTTPTSSAWFSVLLTFGLLAAALAALSLRGSPTRRAAMAATAAAVVWALEATFIKAATDTLASVGVAGTFSRWPIYAVAVGGIIGTLLVQTALHVGPLRVSQPLMVSVDPFVSIILGIWLFGEHYVGSPVKIAFGCASFAVLVIGIVLMVHTSPPNLEPSVEVSASPGA
jgi:drug/metabolite transporter (DMT)-like permease